MSIRKKISWAAAILIVALTIYSAIQTYLHSDSETTEVAYTEFMAMVKEGEIETIKWDDDSEEISFFDDNGNEYKTENPKYEDFKKEMLELGIDVEEKQGLAQYGSTIMTVAIIAVYCALFAVLIARTSGGIGNLKDGDVSSNVRFSDVAGLTEVKEDLSTVVDFLKNPDKYTKAGADIPKGILLYGPPGTGKTLLAKAVAGEASVSFKALSGSDFDEKYVGVGANRMRKLFRDAKHNAPCIIFIDEIDAMGVCRNGQQENSDRQTLNTLLSEMDGFDGSEGIIVMAATNRLEDLDPALTRPGRFDKHFAVSLPETPGERKEIIDLYAKNKQFADNVNLEDFAKVTVGSSPAMIKSVLNEAAILAAGAHNGIITKEILDEAWMKQLLEGHLKRNNNRRDIEIVAWHEAGHALAGLLLGQDLTKVSIIPSTSGAGGATLITPKKMGLFTKEELKEQVMVLYAGRNAELLYSDEDDKITTGASDDIRKATEIIKQMISEYGMSHVLGPLNLTVLDIKPSDITDEAKRIANNLCNDSMRLLLDNRSKLEKIARALLNKETLTGEEVKNIASE